MPKPSNEIKAIDPGNRQIAKIYSAPFKTLMSNSAEDGKVLQLDTDRPLGTGFHLYRMAPGTTTQAHGNIGHEEFLMIEGDLLIMTVSAMVRETSSGCAL